MRKVSGPMLKVLRNVAAGLRVGDHLRTQSEHGGMAHVIRALVVRGLLTWDHELTDEGRQLLKELGA